MQYHAHNNSLHLTVTTDASISFQENQFDSPQRYRHKQPKKQYSSQNVKDSIKHFKLKLSEIEKMMRKKSSETERVTQEMAKVSQIGNFHLRKTAPFDQYLESPTSTKSGKNPSRCYDLLAKAGEIIKKSQKISQRLRLNQSQDVQVPKDKYNSFFNTSQTNLSFSGTSYSYSPSFKKYKSKKPTQMLTPQNKGCTQLNKDSQNQKMLENLQSENVPLQPNHGFTLKKVQISAKPVQSKNKTSSKDDFQFLKELGVGKFGEVYLGRHIETGFLVAIKKVSKQTLIKYNMVQRFSQQIYLHSKLDHPNIVKFYGFFEEKDHICLVLQYLSGGTLFDFQNDKGTFTIKEATGFLKELISALTYLHEKHIAHRDIKPENIVLSSTGMAKLCDFGWSIVVQSLRTTFCGTLDYAPPEVLERKSYDWSVDVWCLGILTYELLIGHAPFQNQDRQKVMQAIMNVDKAQLPGLQNIPQQAQQFIKAILQKDPQRRPKITQLLGFSFFSEGNKRSKALE